MTVGELKKSLSRLPPDMDEVLVILKTAENIGGKPRYSQAGGTGYVEDPLCVLIMDDISTAEEIAKSTILKNAAEHERNTESNG